MKKILLLFSICLIPMLGYAQTDENGKERVYIDYFSRPGTISNILAEALRNKVIEGIQKMDRVELIDVDSNEALKTEAKRRQEASAMGDAVCRSEVMTTLGAQYLIQGNITSMQGVKKTDSKGKTYYQGSVSYTLKIVDPSNGTLKGTQTFTHEGLTGNIGDTPDEAIIKTLDYVVISMDDFVDEYFKMKGTIVQIESTKKDKAQTVYIDLGTKRGVQKGQKFIVYIEMDIAGELSLKEVGRLNVKEVLSGTRSLCTVSKGGEEIMKASKEEKKLIILSRKIPFRRTWTMMKLRILLLNLLVVYTIHFMAQESYSNDVTCVKADDNIAVITASGTAEKRKMYIIWH